MFYPRDDIVVKMQWSLVLTTCQPSLVCNISGNRRPTDLPVSGLPPPGETARKPAMTVISLAKQDLGPKVSQSKRQQHLPHQYSLLTHTNNASPEQAKNRQPSKTTNTLSSKHTNEISIHIYKHASPGVCIFPAPAVQSASCNLATPKTHPSCPSTQRKKKWASTPSSQTQVLYPTCSSSSRFCTRTHAHTHTRQHFATARRSGAGMHRHSSVHSSRACWDAPPPHRHMHLCVSFARLDVFTRTDRPTVVQAAPAKFLVLSRYRVGVVSSLPCQTQVPTAGYYKSSQPIGGFGVAFSPLPKRAALIRPGCVWRGRLGGWHGFGYLATGGDFFFFLSLWRGGGRGSSDCRPLAVLHVRMFLAFFLFCQQTRQVCNYRAAAVGG